jgi:hypothetical protein
MSPNYLKCESLPVELIYSYVLVFVSRIGKCKKKFHDGWQYGIRYAMQMNFCDVGTFWGYFGLRVWFKGNYRLG